MIFRLAFEFRSAALLALFAQEDASRHDTVSMPCSKADMCCNLLEAVYLCSDVPSVTP